MPERDEPADPPGTRPPASRPEGAFEGPGLWTAAGGSSPTGRPPESSGDGSQESGAGRHRRPTRRRGSFLRELPVLLAVALVLAFLLRTFVVQVFYIPSSSMEPTLQRDDRMVVEKLTYRFREPRRGEILVFEGDGPGTTVPEQDAVGRVIRGIGQFLGLVPVSARDFVKRAVALPGDEIEIVDGEVRVNGQALDEPYVRYEDQSQFGPLIVPEGQLFFLGDNRPNSSDSRSTLGTVPREQVVGRSVLIIWPFDHFGRLTGDSHQVPDRPPDPDPAD